MRLNKMKGYGLPRNHDVQYPDVLDIRTYGLNTSAGGKDYFPNKASKKASRRYWKRVERMNNKVDKYEYI
jgi:hypothetical protein